MTQDNEKDLVLISVFTCLTVFLWVFFELVKTVKTTTVAPTVSKIISPFTPKLDAETITALESKKVY